MSAKSINDFLIRMFVCVILYFTLLSVAMATPSTTPRCVTRKSNLQDNLVTSPIIFTGRVTSRSSVYNKLYFVSFRVLKVLKGKLPKRLRKQLRLLFAAHRSNTENCNRQQHPVQFHVKYGKKYIVFVEKLGPGRYSAVAQPLIHNRKTKKSIKKILCQNCISAPLLEPLQITPKVVNEGSQIKLKCLLRAGNPTPEITWMRNGYPLKSHFRFSVKNKKKRSVLRIRGIRRNDSGNYSCRAKNILGESMESSIIVVRYSNPNPPASQCPITSFCLNGGTCLFYQVIGELVCRCTEGFAGQRCQFKKAKIDLPFVENESSCGPYGHDIHLQEVCAAWKKSPDLTEMTMDEYRDWKRVERELEELKRKREEKDLKKFKSVSSKRRLLLKNKNK